MPELPEVETTLRGISPHLAGQTISEIIIRHHRLRWPVPATLRQAKGQKIIKLSRRAKYLLLDTARGTIVIHLGMSGRLRVLTDQAAAQKHDHVDFVFTNRVVLRYTDPRRFGAILWTPSPASHPLLKTLGVEPLEKAFTANYLRERAKGRATSIKSLIMDSKVVVGVGNIYAAEALFLAGIHPAAAAGSLTPLALRRLVAHIKAVLKCAIKQGGTTLRDFTGSDGKPGYFKQKLNVYGRAGQPCVRCHNPLHSLRIAQRATVYCPQCQDSA